MALIDLLHELVGGEGIIVDDLNAADLEVEAELAPVGLRDLHLELQRRAPRLVFDDGHLDGRAGLPVLEDNHTFCALIPLAVFARAVAGVEMHGHLAPAIPHPHEVDVGLALLLLDKVDGRRELHNVFGARGCGGLGQAPVSTRARLGPPRRGRLPVGELFAGVVAPGAASLESELALRQAGVCLPDEAIP